MLNTPFSNSIFPPKQLMAGFLKQAFLEMFLSPTQCLKSAFLGTMANTARSFSSLSQHAMGPRHFPFQQVLFLLGFNTECSATLLNSCRCREELRNRGLSYRHFYISKRVCLLPLSKTHSHRGWLGGILGCKKMKLHFFF